MEAKAVFKYIRKSPRKLRLIVDSVRGLHAQAALDQLKFNRKPDALIVHKVIQSAVANASLKQGVRVDKLYVKAIMVEQAPTMKRWMPRAKGSASPILKRMSHLRVILDERL